MIVINSSSVKLAEWVKKLKAHKAEQLEKLRNVEKCDFAFTLSWGIRIKLTSVLLKTFSKLLSENSCEFQNIIVPLGE